MRSDALHRNHNAAVPQELEIVIAKARQLSIQQYSEREDRLHKTTEFAT